MSVLEKIKEKLILSIRDSKESRIILMERYSLILSYGRIEKDSIYYASLNNLNEVYHLGVDMTCRNADTKVMEALRNLISLLDYEIAEDERIIAAIENGFSSYVGNIPAMILDIFINETDDIDISEIFLSQLRANNAYYQTDGEVAILTYQEERFDEFKDYEIKLLEAFETRNFGTFKDLALGYFRYYYKSKALKKMFAVSGVSMKEILLKVDDLIEAMRIKYFAKKKEIPKEMVNIIRNLLDESIEEDKGSVEMMLKEMINVNKAQGKPTFDLIEALNRTYKLKLKMNADYNRIFSAFQEAVDVVTLDGKKVETLKGAIAREGIKKPVLGLPRLMFTILESNLAFQYIILMGIKTNGESVKNNLDNLEKQLYDLEIQMAKLINTDYSVSTENKEEFMKIYAEYLKLYANYLDNNLVDANNSKASKRVRNILHNMNLYIDNSPAWLVQDEICKPVVASKPIVHEVVVDPLDEFIQNGVVVKFGPLEQFKELLRNSSLSQNKQYEYVRQMVNFRNRNIDTIISSFLSEFLEDGEMAIYAQAKNSNNEEVQSIVRDIEAAVMLMLDNMEEAEAFKDECREYIEILENKMEKQPIDSEDIFNVLYFKTSDNKPFILQSLDSKCFKQVKLSLNKIIGGKLDGDKEIKGLNSEFHFKVKGKNTKVVYLVINGVTIIIGAFDDMAEVKAIVTSREFLEYMNVALGLIKNKTIPNEREYTNYVLNILSGKNTVARA